MEFWDDVIPYQEQVKNKDLEYPLKKIILE